MKDELKKEFTRRITQADAVSMITILYEMTLAYLQEAKEDFQEGKKDSFAHEIHRAQDCLLELKESLHLKYEPAPALNRLYLFMHRALMQSIVYDSIKPLKQPVRILERLRDAYLTLEKNGSREPVMENVQQIYAGLTYGKNSLVESTPQTDGNRGFLA